MSGTQTAKSMEARAREAGIPIMYFDIQDGDDFRQDAFGVFDKARNTAPIIYSNAARGFWVLSDFAVVEDAIKTPSVFSNTGIEVHRREDHLFPPMIPETLDPPEHHKYRKALAPMFSPRAVADMEVKFRDLTRSYIDKVVGKREIDFMVEIGRPLPADFFLTLMDIPQAMREPLTEALITANFTPPSEDPSGEIRMQNTMSVIAAIEELIAAKKKNPGDDIFSQIMQRKVDDRLLNDEELLSIGILLANAGVETTGGALGYMFELLGQSPAHRKQINDNIDNLVPAVEELLRVFPVANSTRVVMQDVDFHGVPLRKGDRVVINRIAANRDPALLDRGDEVLLDRIHNNHATFGDGIHHCLGAHVARREIRLALEEWHKRIPEYRISPDHVPHHHVGTTISLTSLPMILG